jgi:predicted TIM-barrel fold metal-dependent hydrolase
MNVFDFHARLVPHGDLTPLYESGITRAVVSAGGVVDLDRLSAQLVDGGHVETDADNEAVRAAGAASGGRLVPFYLANPYAGVEPYRKQAHHFRGLELAPAVYGVGFDDPRTVALVAVAAEAGHPVYTVCLGRPGTHARDLVALARRFPAVPFVFGHCGLIPLDTNGIATIAAQRNIVAETSGCYTATVRIAIDRLGPDRVVFGTEYPIQDPGVELAKLSALRLDAGTWTKVAWRNAHRLLGEECP